MEYLRMLILINQNTIIINIIEDVFIQRNTDNVMFPGISNGFYPKL